MKSKFLVFLTVISMLFGIFLCNISYAEQIDTQENIDITSLENETEQVDTGSIESSSVDTKEETEIINNTQQEDELDNKEITSQTDETSNKEGISTKEEDIIVDNLDDSEEPEESDDFKDELDQEKDIVIEGSKEEPIIIETEIIETRAPIYELNRSVTPERETIDLSKTIAELKLEVKNFLIPLYLPYLFQKMKI